jgi:hypothetical protein
VSLFGGEAVEEPKKKKARRPQKRAGKQGTFDTSLVKKM